MLLTKQLLIWCRTTTENSTKLIEIDVAAMATSVRDISKATGRDSFAAVAARSVPVTKVQPLPTPPNSISPNLLPHGKAYGTRSAVAQALEQVDSDLDLHGDGQTGSDKDTFPENSSEVGSPGLDTVGTITPTLLARHHLPEILLAHGPLAIRHIMGYLTTSVPGFSGIPPAKARRLVVGALEGRGSGGEGGGTKGDVKFEKVGWGRWDARLKGHARNSRSRQHSPQPSGLSPSSTAMPITRNRNWKDGRDRLNVPGSSWTGDSAVFSHDDEMDLTMLENEADKMSLDGEDSCSSSEAAPEDEVMDEDDSDDVTDDEDWAAVGAAALRAASYSASGLRGNFLSPNNIYPGGSYSGGGPSLNIMAKSVPLRPSQPNIDFATWGMTSDAQEREAIEALLRLGSV
jgi:hypothetical protein